VGQQDRDRALVFRADVQEMDAESVDAGAELAEAVQPGFHPTLAPIAATR
jgi:hypothetical protein